MDDVDWRIGNGFGNGAMVGGDSIVDGDERGDGAGLRYGREFELARGDRGEKPIARARPEIFEPGKQFFLT